MQARARFLDKEHLFRQKAAPELKEQHVQLEGDWGVESCNVPLREDSQHQQSKHQAHGQDGAHGQLRTQSRDTR